MTRNEILAMQRGPELDAAVGRAFNIKPKVMYCVMDRDEKGIIASFDCKIDADSWLNAQTERFPAWVERNGAHIVRVEEYPNYSQDISAAFEVFEYFTKLGCWVEVRYNNRKNTYGALIVKDGREIYGEVSWKDDIKTAPEAICKAALLAVMAE